MEKQVYDLIIIGAGPAGLNAAVYAARYNLNTLVFGEKLGGMVSEANEICNFLSHTKIRGFELAIKMRKQVEESGIEIKQENVKEIIKKENRLFEIKTDINVYISKKLILATGTEKRKLNLPKENKFKSRGISYYAVCDAIKYKNKVVAVVGGGNSSLSAALLLADLADKVYIIYRKDKFFRPEPNLIESVKANNRIEALFNSAIIELIGEENLTAIKLNNKQTINLAGLFIEAGSIPNNDLAKNLGIVLENNYIKVDKNQKTSITGIFAAGDITNNSLKQIITAAAEGAIAARAVYTELIAGGD